MAASGVTAQTGSGELSTASLAGILTSFSKANGQSNPGDERGVRSDRASGLAVTDPGDTVDASDDAVYVLTATGNFTGYTANVPPGAPFPTGDNLYMIVAAQTGEVLDWGITPTAPDISKLGTPIALG